MEESLRKGPEHWAIGVDEQSLQRESTEEHALWQSCTQDPKLAGLMPIVWE